MRCLLARYSQQATPGDPDTDAGKRSEELLATTVEWSEDIYNWDPEEIKRYVYQFDQDGTPTKAGIAYIQYSYSQIGLTREWFKFIAAKINNMMTVRREILLQRLRGSSESPYDRDDIERLIDMAKKPVTSIMLNKYYRMDIYERLQRGIPYLVGIDCSTGSNKDNNAMTVVNPYTKKVCAEFECSYVGEPEFIECIIDLVTRHIPRAILCIERNSVGDAIIKFLLRSKIAGRVYFDKFKDIQEDNMKELETTEDILKRKAKNESHYGVYTDPKSRPVMFSILANWIKNEKDKFVGQNVTRDISKLVIKGAKIQAAKNWHDDSVMSLLIALYVYYYGNNLEIFGFSRGDEFYHMEQNQGLIRPEEIDTSEMSEDVKGFVEQKVRESKYKDFDTLLEQHIMRQQQRDIQLVKKGMIHNELYENSPTVASDEIDYNYGQNTSEDDLRIFDELNVW